MAAREKYQVPSAPGEGPRPCARGMWCSASTRDADGGWHPALSYQPFCTADRAKIVTDAESLPAAYVRLAAQIGAPARTSRAVRVPPGSRVLISGDIDALLRTTAAVLGGWAARVRAVPGLHLTPHAHVHGSMAAVAADCGVLAKHPDPLLALPYGPMLRTWTWRPGGPMPADVDAEIGGLDAVHGGDGWVTAFTRLAGTAAGLEIIDLYRRAVRLLAEDPAPAEILEGVPCRACEAMSSLARAEQPPPDPEKPALPFSRCLRCRDEMTRREYEAWAAMYAAWTKGSGILTCRRCDLGMCGDCCWPGCSCRGPGHAAA